MSKAMKKPIDPVIEEIHETRREIAQRFGGDIHRISEDARRRQSREGRPVWHPKTANQSLDQTADGIQRNG